MIVQSDITELQHGISFLGKNNVIIQFFSNCSNNLPVDLGIFCQERWGKTELGTGFNSPTFR